jgi:hypothetical protein
MTKLVIDPLEAVQVRKEQEDLTSATAGRLQAVLGQQAEPAPVEQTRQIVPKRPPDEHALRASAQGDGTVLTSLFVAPVEKQDGSSFWRTHRLSG